MRTLDYLPKYATALPPTHNGLKLRGASNLVFLHLHGANSNDQNSEHGTSGRVNTAKCLIRIVQATSVRAGLRYSGRRGYLGLIGSNARDLILLVVSTIHGTPIGGRCHSSTWKGCYRRADALGRGHVLPTEWSTRHSGLVLCRPLFQRSLR